MFDRELIGQTGFFKTNMVAERERAFIKDSKYSV